jgi:hypothetical protein
MYCEYEKTGREVEVHPNYWWNKIENLVNDFRGVNSKYLD